jgi:predicted nucleotidyltransferase
MGTSPRQTVESLRRRWGAQRTADRVAARSARELLPRLASTLRERGAVEVVLFGSLAEGRFTGDSDIDLAVRGASERSLAGLSYDLTLLAHREVEIVRLEDAPSSLVRRIYETGERL